MPDYQSSLAREMAKLDADRTSWRHALAQTDAIAKRMRELTLTDSVYARAFDSLNAIQSPASAIAQQYQDILGGQSLAIQSVKAWQEADRVQHEHMRRLLDPLAGIRKSLLANNTAQHLIKRLTEAGPINADLRELIGWATETESMATLLAGQAEESQEQQKRFLDSVSIGNSVQNYLKDFERINRHWMVPSEVLGIVGSFKEIQEKIGGVALPTIDWGSAGALAKLLGHDGIQMQLALLGIGADGTMRISSGLPEKGILSRKQSDVVALVGLLMSLLFFIYQESSNQQDKVKTEASQALTTYTLQVQAQQIQNLTLLIGHALTQAAKEPKDSFVVRERPATVRAKPEHGSSVEGKLLPNEVVLAIDRQGRWVEIQYYHWLHEEYRTGWVLKHYLERVPANYSKIDE